jgi:hypothetical protein
LPPVPSEAAPVVTERSGQIFISYSRDDAATAKALAALLEARGYSVWWDFSLVAGKRFREEIAEAIERATTVLVIWSPHSVKSGFVLDEATRAAEKGKLVPLSIGGAFPPLGFGHLHTLPIDSIERDLDRIIAAVEGAPAQFVPARKKPRSRWPLRIVIVVGALLLAGGAIAALVDRHHVDATINCVKFGCDLNYSTYRSRNLRLQFVYPMKQLALDTTVEHLHRLPMLNRQGNAEVEITRAPMPSHRSPLQGSAEEQKSLKEKGWRITYIAPQVDPSSKNWYVIAGLTADGRHFYTRRWYTAGDVVSMEFNYAPEYKALYDKIIVDMTLRGIWIEDPM